MRDYWLWMRDLYRREGHKAFYKQFRFHVKRPWSRSLIRRFAPTGQGLELGVGSQSIAPRSRTLLSDSSSEHGGDTRSLAQAYFSAYQIPYPDSTFRFVLSEHMLEHLSNPLKALREIVRVLNVGGVLILFLPHRARTFDRLRPRTTLEHLIDDERVDRGDNDPTHFREWRERVIDTGLLPAHYQGLPESEWIARAAIHHHVWEGADLAEVFRHLGLEVLLCEEQVPDRLDSFVVVGRK
jgi:SAM-dependent methyltransferase